MTRRKAFTQAAPETRRVRRPPPPPPSRETAGPESERPHSFERSRIRLTDVDERSEEGTVTRNKDEQVTAAQSVTQEPAAAAAQATQTPPCAAGGDG
jgi:hypothetical protein